MLNQEEQSLLEKVFSEEGLTSLSLDRGETIAARTGISLRAVEWFALGRGIIPRRYERSIGSFGLEGQRRLLESRVIVIGLGGLGGHLVEHLARAGVGRITGVDPDAFDETNLNRQLLAEEGNLGQKKTDVARKRVQRVNRAVEFVAHTAALMDLPAESFRGAQVVFDGLDTIDDRLALAERCAAANVPLVHGAIGGWYGEVGVIWPGPTGLEKFYRRRGRGIEQSLGNPSFTAGLAASLMAGEGIKILLGKTADREPKLIFFDLREGDWQTISL